MRWASVSSATFAPGATLYSASGVVDAMARLSSPLTSPTPSSTMTPLPCRWASSAAAAYASGAETWVAATRDSRRGSVRSSRVGMKLLRFIASNLRQPSRTNVIARSFAYLASLFNGTGGGAFSSIAPGLSARRCGQTPTLAFARHPSRKNGVGSDRRSVGSHRWARTKAVRATKKLLAR